MIATGRRRFHGIAALVVLSIALVARGQSSATGPSTPATSATTQPAAPGQVSFRASDEFLQHLQDQLRTVVTVEADFIQKKNLVVFDHTLTIRGHFALQKPDRVVWIVHEPVRYAVRLQGDEVRQWDQDTNKVQVTHLGGDPAFKAISQQVQGWFLGDYKVLSESFNVDVVSQKPLSLDFTPKPESMAAKFLEHVEITFGKDELYIDHMVVREVGGDVTTLNFIGTRINQPVRDQIWEIPPHE